MLLMAPPRVPDSTGNLTTILIPHAAVPRKRASPTCSVKLKSNVSLLCLIISGEDHCNLLARALEGKWVCLVTLAMSLFDLQDVCIVIGSLATLDLPMVIDLIGIYVLKGPYCMLTTTNWFLQALSVIPRGSWGDVARRFTMSWSRARTQFTLTTLAPKIGRPLPLPTSRRCRPPPSAAADDFVIGLVSINVTRRIRSCQNPSDLLVQIDGGIAFPVVDLIRRSTAVYLLKCRFPCETGQSQAPRRQQSNNR
ncbi:Methylmalonate-semialdehyde dehydrogenase [Dorcoceras hygrometricum]|uniref:Methylmalonate-semialdehyde dehydrogenase n=1 Tax=Dorcoceras hygrometricum TaxID=472368 RepID=A0A2Z7AG62_9LAMI|nr:Methylmalonate-semialdehyde dehydrogenase [Dorcoceras hygrometricum]